MLKITTLLLSGQTTKYIALNLFGKFINERRELKLVNLKNLATATKQMKQLRKK
jgi:hypothetical protein